jgi:hypothetical protein
MHPRGPLAESTDKLEMDRRIYKVTMTEGQQNYWMKAERGSTEWWERLADITEISPAWLRDNLGALPLGFFGRKAFKEAIRQKALSFANDVLFIIAPVPQKDSGVLTRMAEFA